MDFGRMKSLETYDAVFSLGQWCATAIYLKKAGLRSFSGPFDWLGPTTELPAYFDTMCADFSGFMAKENLVFMKADPIEGTDHFEDRLTGWQTHHEFTTGVDFDTNYRMYQSSLSRRSDRFRRVCAEGKSVLLVHLHVGGRYDAGMILANMRRLREKYSASRIDLLLLEAEDHQAGLVWETLTDGVFRVTGDFYDRARFDAVMGNEPLVCSVLRAVRVRGRWRNLLRLRVLSLRKRLMRKLGPRKGKDLPG